MTADGAAPAASPGPASMLALQRTLDRVPWMLAYWDTELCCRYANCAYERWFGLEPSQVIGKSLPELLGPALFALNEPHVRAALRGESQSFECVVPGPDGVLRPSLAHYVPDVVDGVVLGFVAQVSETTTLKHADAELREREMRFRRLAESSPFAVLHVDTNGQVDYASPLWHAMTGLNVGLSNGRPWWQNVHAQDMDAVRRAWQTAASRLREFEAEFRVCPPTGSVRVLRLRARPHVPQPGAGAGADAGGYVGGAEDVTEQREVAQRLRAAESFLASAGRVAAVGGWELDLKTGAISWSEQTRRLHEVEPDYQPTLDSAIAFYPPDARTQVDAAIALALRDGTPWDLELPFVTARGRARWVRAVGDVEMLRGVPVRLVGAVKDVTDERQRREDLVKEHALRLEVERHADGLDRLLHERGAMLDVMAHEVRQPLNNASAALQSASGVLASVGEQVASQRLVRAQTVMTQVMASIDNTLAVAALLARPEPIQREDTDIDMLLGVAVADMPPGERGRVQVQRDSAARSVSMDMSLMRLALRNLLSNALKYSPPGSPVSMRLSDSEAPAALCIDISSAGLGIPGELLPRLFERSPHVQRDEAPAQRGLGLGLYIVRRVMELHGGQALLAANGAEGVTMRLLLNDEASA